MPLADYVPVPVNDDRLAVQYGFGLPVPVWLDNVEFERYCKLKCVIVQCAPLSILI